LSKPDKPHLLKSELFLLPVAKGEVKASRKKTWSSMT
jgi:hypothetical protein